MCSFLDAQSHCGLRGRSAYLTWSGAVSVLWTVSTMSCILPGCPTHWSDRLITIELQCFWLSSVTSLCVHLSLSHHIFDIYLYILYSYTFFDLFSCRFIFSVCLLLQSLHISFSLSQIYWLFNLFLGFHSFHF